MEISTRFTAKMPSWVTKIFSAEDFGANIAVVGKLTELALFPGNFLHPKENERGVMKKQSGKGVVKKQSGRGAMKK